MTNGHLDLIARGAKIFDHLVVAILRNSAKNPLFTVEERVEMLTEGLAPFGNVSIATFDGLLVDFARDQHAQAVMRGIRAISDYEYEFQMALMNRRLAPELETIFLMPDAKYSFVSSRLVKEVFILRRIGRRPCPEAGYRPPQAARAEELTNCAEIPISSFPTTPRKSEKIESP